MTSFQIIENNFPKEAWKVSSNLAISNCTLNHALQLLHGRRICMITTSSSHTSDVSRTNSLSFGDEVNLSIFHPSSHPCLLHAFSHQGEICSISFGGIISVWFERIGNISECFGNDRNSLEKLRVSWSDFRKFWRCFDISILRHLVMYTLAYRKIL